MYIWLVLLSALLAAMIIHEAAHAFMIVRYGIRIKGIKFGYPEMFSYQIKNCKISLGPLILIAGVDVDNQEFYQLSAWKRIMIFLAGPLANIVVFLVIFGAFAGFSGILGIANGLVQGIQAFTPPATPPLNYLVENLGPQTQGLLIDWLTFFLLLNLMLGIGNLMPIPALDGGHIAFTLLEKVFGHKKALRLNNLTHRVVIYPILAYVVIQSILEVVYLFLKHL
jgi:membrane-associated protease RseP (regulator of RpoE activity)